MSILQRRALSLLLIMALAALLAWSVRPTERLADQGAALDLETLVPHQFAGWELDERQSAAVVNPQAGELQSRIYQQVLARTYIQRSTGRQRPCCRLPMAKTRVAPMICTSRMSAIPPVGFASNKAGGARSALPKTKFPYVT